MRWLLRRSWVVVGLVLGGIGLAGYPPADADVTTPVSVSASEGDAVAGAATASKLGAAPSQLDSLPPEAAQQLSQREYGPYEQVHSWPIGGLVDEVAFSPDGTKILAGARDNTARLFDVESREEIYRWNYRSLAWTVAFSPDGNRVLIGAAGGTVELHDVRDLPNVRLLHSWSFGGVIDTVRFSPDGIKILVGGSVGTGARLYDVESRRELHHWNHDPVVSVAFSPSWSLVSVGTPRGAFLYDVESGREIRKWRHVPAWSVLFSSDGARVLTNGRKKAHLYDIAGGQEIRSYSHGSWVWSAVFSPDERFVLTCGRLDNNNPLTVGQACLFDTGSARKLHCWEHRNEVFSAVFSPDGRFVLTGSGAVIRGSESSVGQMRMFALPPNMWPLASPQ